MADGSEQEIWGDRATSLTEAMSVMSSPIQMGTLCHFAMRKGWEQKTLEGVLAYCQRQQLVEPYKAFNGKAAFKLTGTAVPTTPAAETDPDEDDEQPEADEAAPAPTILDCLCARTAPHKNYGCPEHGGARIKEDHDMAKDWIPTAEAMELLGLKKSHTIRLGHTKRIDMKKDGDGGRAPLLFRRTSVVAYRDAQRKEQAATDLLPATPTKRAAKAPKKPTAIVPVTPAPAIVATVVGPQADALVEVRVLVRWVDKGWFSQEDAWTKLRELVA